MFSQWTTCCGGQPTGNTVDPRQVGRTPTWPVPSRQPRAARVKEQRGVLASRAEHRVRGRISRTQACPPNRVRSVVTEKRGPI